MTKISANFLIKIIESLAPLNNELRNEKEPLKKIEKMWEMGQIINSYMFQCKVKLHDLLIQLYDPHSTVKVSNVTRDLGSYCYRIFKYFKTKEDIKRTLPNLRSYTVFREAIPLLFNIKYQITDKRKIFSLINSYLPDLIIKSRLKKLRKKIRHIQNPRTQKAEMYIEEKKDLQILVSKIKKIYSENKIIPSDNLINTVIGTKEYRKILVAILLVLAHDIFINKLINLKAKKIPHQLVNLFKISQSETVNRSRFRKWVLSSNRLLSLAEGIEALEKKENYSFYRKKYFSNNDQVI
jgi:hypothetical protein